MSADPRREYEEAFLSGQRARKQNFDPAITVHEFTLESMGRKIAELEKLNAELLAALKACRWCAVQLMEGDIVEQADAVITKAEEK